MTRRSEGGLTWEEKGRDFAFVGWKLCVDGGIHVQRGH